MPRPCSVCTHADRPEIDRALEAGEPFRKVAERYGLSPASLSRHKANHLEASCEEDLREPEQHQQHQASDFGERLEALEDQVQLLRRAVGVIGEAVVGLAKRP